MKFNTAFALFVTTMTIDSEFGVAASSASALASALASASASASEELPPRPTRKVRVVFVSIMYSVFGAFDFDVDVDSMSIRCFTV